MNDVKKRIAIIGGGAAGMTAAIAAAKQVRDHNLPVDVVIYESQDRIGKSLLVTGNGRCNFSNAALEVDAYWNADFVRESFEVLTKRFGSDYVHTFLRELGLVWREEADGRQFPLANKASSLLDVLRAALTQLQVSVCCDAVVERINPPQDGSACYTLHLKDGQLQRAHSLIYACGGAHSGLLDTFKERGLRYLDPRPVLGPLKVTEPLRSLVRELDNIRVKSILSLSRKQDGAFVTVATETGELMFRKYGISGICVFNLSRFAQAGDVVFVNFLKMSDNAQALQMLQRRFEQLSGLYGNDISYETLLRGLLLPRLVETLLKSAAIQPSSRVQEDDLPKLVDLLISFPLEVTDIADPDIAQVSRGGLAVDDVNPETLSVDAFPGFHVAGEALDVDGPCGGYNLHWAWASGILAGRGAFDDIQDD